MPVQLRLPAAMSASHWPNCPTPDAPSYRLMLHARSQLPGEGEMGQRSVAAEVSGSFCAGSSLPGVVASGNEVGVA